jgi:hypothetical protein
MLLQPNNNKFGLYKEKSGLKLLPPQKGLICNLDMEKIVGTTIYDRTANGYNATTLNTTIGSGIKDLNKEITHNGTNSTTQTALSLFDYTEWTFEIWFKMETLSSSNNIVLSDGKLGAGGSVNDRLLFLGYVGTDPEIRIDAFMPTQTTLYTGVDAELNKWYHCVVTYKSSNTTISAYINNSTKVSSSSFPINQTPQTKGFKLGHFTLSAGNYAYYNNSCSIFRFWDRILLDKEIQYLYNNGYGIK